jgi:hypothetical protein
MWPAICCVPSFGAFCTYNTMDSDRIYNYNLLYRKILTDNQYFLLIQNLWLSYSVFSFGRNSTDEKLLTVKKTPTGETGAVCFETPFCRQYGIYKVPPGDV